MLYHNYFIDFLQFGPYYYYSSFISNFFPRAHWMRPKTHLEWFLHPLHTHTRCLRPFICCGWADGSTIMPLPPYLSAQNLGSWLISWVTARLQMMQGWIGWGPRPTCNGSHIHSIHIQGIWDHSYVVAVDGQMGPPSCHYHHTCCRRN